MGIVYPVLFVQQTAMHAFHLTQRRNIKTLKCQERERDKRNLQVAVIGSVIIFCQRKLCVENFVLYEVRNWAWLTVFPHLLHESWVSSLCCVSLFVDHSLARTDSPVLTNYTRSSSVIECSLYIIIHCYLLTPEVCGHMFKGFRRMKYFH